MVQSVLFFALGFLCAGFLALVITPAVWRRAVSLTRKRVETSIPLTLSEIQADKDRVRAESAMSTRRLEITIKSLREKAAEQLVEIGRGHEDLKKLVAERAEKNQASAALEATIDALKGELRHREEQLQRQSDRLAEAEHAMEGRAMELEKLGHMYDDASFSSSSRQIELVARESELDKLVDEVALLREQRRDADQRHREVVAEGRLTQDALKAEKKRALELDKKLERMLATLADREEKLDRRDRDLARLRLESQNDRLKPKSDRAALTLVSSTDGEDVDMAIAKLESARERLEARLTTLARENKKLRTDLAALESSGPGDRSGSRREGALLREQMHDLAAEVVNLTVKLDGPESPIVKALAVPANARNDADGDRIVSLADRVRALQKVKPAS